jgi:hypothetical protein
MKEQWKFVGRRPSPGSGGDVYLWRCEARRKSGQYLWAIPVASLIAKP